MLLGILLAWSVVPAGGHPADLPVDPPFRIVFPHEGDVINNGTLVQAVRPDTLPPDDSEVVFEFSPDDGATYVPIEGIAPRRPPGDAAALWNTKRLQGGDYLLRARLVPRTRMPALEGVTAPDLEVPDASGIATDPVQVHVNEQPFALSTATVVASTRGSITVGFDASGSFDADGSVTAYEWMFDDGTEAAGPQVQHSYQGAGTSKMILRITDDRGGIFTGYHDVEVLTGPVPGVFLTTTSFCGCQSMTIKVGGDVEGPPGFGFGGPEPTKLGAYPHPYSGSGYISCRFEIIATLTGGSDPALCAEGQAVGATIYGWSTVPGYENWWLTSSQTLFPAYDSEWSHDDPYTAANPDPSVYDNPNVTEQVDCPYEGGDWCDDSYHGGGSKWGDGVPGEEPPLLTKTYEPGFPPRILWIDSPWYFPQPQPNNPSYNGQWYRLRFNAVVAGKDGPTCRCLWEVSIKVDQNGNVLENQVLNSACGTIP
jgi:hypothetical protein